MKRSKRLKKKLAQYQCPKCNCKDGIVAHIFSGKIHKQVFVYCAGCKWEYELDMKRGNNGKEQPEVD